ncbi:AlpA family phage regulatory protein [Bradyrhizobium pachyrhizi]|uniref:helix-turn-helix transcriptional regulator n=1 Tax=Bradyrhizobium pachyrhizi TaxID=280333 RepID=UPI0024B056E7|nr:AlpA family phage regulatory protein [Bradyrhizobium pachyrhizi]WFU52362.1 AlpA family phage regulatory protein [Bradyrhizobium pachyrhizi]
MNSAEVPEIAPEIAPAIRQMVSIKDVLKKIPMSRSTLERKVKEGTFPKMYSIAPMRVGFFLDDVLQWQSDLVENAIRPSEPVRVLVRGRH